jgi:predicted metal-binding protein
MGKITFWVMEMVRIVILNCEKIRDRLCIACEKCFKAVSERAGKFEGYDEIEIVAMGSCGGCPGLIVPKMKLITTVAKALDRDFDKIFLGTCMVAATKTGKCPLDLEEVKKILEEKFGKEVIIGTHPW